MTRKDYVLIAASIAKLRKDYDFSQQAINEIATTLAHDLRSTNPNFNYLRFTTACGAT